MFTREAITTACSHLSRCVCCLYLTKFSTHFYMFANPRCDSNVKLDGLTFLNQPKSNNSFHPPWAVKGSLQNVKLNQTGVLRLSLNCWKTQRWFLRNLPLSGTQTKLLSFPMIFTAIAWRDYPVYDEKLGQEAQLAQWRSEMATFRACFLSGPHSMYK